MLKDKIEVPICYSDTEGYTDIVNYVNDCWGKVKEYAKGVKDGSILTNIYMRNVIQWFQESPEYEIKLNKIFQVFRFLYLININYDSLGYKRIELLPWQAYLIAMIFGMYHRGTDRRRFGECFTFMGRGNGKTTLGVALALYFLLGYYQTSPQSIIISTVENRKKIIDDLHKTVMHSPELSQFLHFNNGAVMLNSYDTYIRVKDKNEPIKRINDVGSVRVVPNDDKKLDGLELVLAFIDEIHLLKDEQVYRNAQKSAGKRKDSLVMLISTAGFQTDGFCVELVERAKKIAMGEIKDDSFLPFLFCLDKDDDQEELDNKNLWYKCNPSLDVTKPLVQMEKYFNNALHSQVAKADFKTKDLNIFIDYNELEVLTEEDRELASKPVDLEKWKGKDCYLGLDLSQVNDLSSLVCLFYDELNDKWEAYPYYWIANDSKHFIRKTGENLIHWVNNGRHITKCESNLIDYGLIAKKIDSLSKQFTIRGIGYDPRFWNEFEQSLNRSEAYCGTRFPVIQKAYHLSESLSKIVRSVHSGNLIWSDNPVMKWNWKNARIRQADGNGNIKIFRNDCPDSPDGAVALNNAMALYFELNLNSKRPGY